MTFTAVSNVLFSTRTAKRNYVPTMLESIGRMWLFSGETTSGNAYPEVDLHARHVRAHAVAWTVFESQ